jgi:hypothetical protein
MNGEGLIKLWSYFVQNGTMPGMGELFNVHDSGSFCYFFPLPNCNFLGISWSL